MYVLTFFGVFRVCLQVFIYVKNFVIKLLSLIISKLRYLFVKSLLNNLDCWKFVIYLYSTKRIAEAVTK